MSYGHSAGGGLKGLMILAMVFVFGAAAYLSARDFEADLCSPFHDNINVERRLGQVRSCAIAIAPSLKAKQIVLQIRGGAGVGLVTVERSERVVTRAYLTCDEHPEPELVLGADPMVPSSRIRTR